MSDWTAALFFRREIVSLWGMHEPLQEFQRAAGVVPLSNLTLPSHAEAAPTDATPGP